MELTFGEQIKILLNRKHITIQDLADMYTERTGRQMSRQNLTQRLKRDNFPEQDMHILAALLGYSVSIQLNPLNVELPEYFRPEPAPRPAQEIPHQTVPQFSIPSFLASRTRPRTEEPLPPPSMPQLKISSSFHKAEPQGDINPLTGEEYQTNTVRRHPTNEAYIQVYDRNSHAWSDVREDFFWQFQEKKKQMMGREYSEPIII